jgi:hypothetical protein
METGANEAGEEEKEEVGRGQLTERWR